MKELTFYVGKEYDKDSEKLSEQQINTAVRRITHLVASLCGSWTAINATSGSLEWESKEDTIVICTLLEETANKDAETVAFIVAEAAKSHFNQDSVLVTCKDIGVAFF